LSFVIQIVEKPVRMAGLQKRRPFSFRFHLCHKWNRSQKAFGGGESTNCGGPKGPMGAKTRGKKMGMWSPWRRSGPSRRGRAETDCCCPTRSLGEGEGAYENGIHKDGVVQMLRKEHARLSKQITAKFVIKILSEKL
jgi:hypothetical protein